MKVWERPRTEVQKFEANEYVAACGDSGVEYYFECNAPKGTVYYYPQADGEVDGIYNGSGSASRLGSYGPCNDTHVTTSKNDFYDGFVDYNNNRRHDAGEGVIVWVEWGWLPFVGQFVTNYHATTNLDIKDWETTRS